MEISEAGIKGLGPRKITALQDAGIVTLQGLAEVDLRTFPRVEGVSKENLKSLKQRARAVCRREGIAFETASYSTGTGNKTTPNKAGADVTPPAKKMGLLGRLFRK